MLSNVCWVAYLCQAATMSYYLNWKATALSTYRVSCGSVSVLLVSAERDNEVKTFFFYCDHVYNHCISTQIHTNLSQNEIPLGAWSGVGLCGGPWCLCRTCITSEGAFTVPWGRGCPFLVPTRRGNAEWAEEAWEMHMLSLSHARTPFISLMVS